MPYGLYKTKNGSVIICVGTSKQYEGLIRSFEIEFDDDRIKEFKTNELRVEKREEFDAFLNK